MTEREYRELKKKANVMILVSPDGKGGGKCHNCEGDSPSGAIMKFGDNLDNKGLCPNCCFLIGQVYERELKGV